MAVGLPDPIVCLIPGVKSEEFLGKNLERHRPSRLSGMTRYLIVAATAGLLLLSAALLMWTPFPIYFHMVGAGILVAIVVIQNRSTTAIADPGT